jgi:phosphoenolpyruvate-protein kinase (PTS system EI component)
VLVGHGYPDVTATVADIGHFHPGNILLCSLPTAAHFEAIGSSAAVLCTEGGLAGHLPSICRARGIAVILIDIHSAAQLANGSHVHLDLNNGRVTILSEIDLTPSASADLQFALTRPEMKVEAVVSGPGDIERVNQSPAANAVGSFFIREEFVWITNAIDPLGMLRTEGATQMAARLSGLLSKMVTSLSDGQKLTFRFLDLRSDEAASLSPGRHQIEPEANPELGLHGLRWMILDRQYQDMIRAVADQVDPDVVTLTLPFVNDEQELGAAFDLLRVSDPSRWGVFIETPAGVDRLPEMLAMGVGAVNVGTKDLTQFILAADRNNRNVAHIYDMAHISVLSAIGKVIHACNKQMVVAKVFALAVNLRSYEAALPIGARYMLCAHEVTRFI